MLPLAALTVIAGGCSTAPLPKPVVQVEFIKPVLPQAALVACKMPVTVPDRDLTAQEVTTYWGRDRASLRSCETKRRALVEAVQ